MTLRLYTLLGWVVWRVARRIVRRKMSENRAKLGAAGVIALVLVGGVLAARASNDE